ncbi:integrase family protein [Mucilaginibacter paludis DSM 18603]|uniref:Integrase family protein n=2 Tax=Mucilaginibacter TaxID=423349 RepID=H1Y5N1_9SPHI|nr:integrase family protein [Mucilaginibacter paludis DSM 18603]
MACRYAKPQTKPYKLYDIEGLYLRIMPNGSKYWRYNFKFHGKSKTYAIGVFPNVSLKEARKICDEAKESIKAGIDPTILKTKAKQLAAFNSDQTFETVAREWHQHYYKTWSEKHADYIIRRLELHAFPHIGRYPLNQLTPQIILTCLQRIEKNAPEIARRVLQMCSKVFQYASLTGRLDKDLTFGLKGAFKKYKKGHYAAIDISELPELLAAINSNEARAYKQTNLAIKLLLYTFVRTGELINAKWSEINFANAMWTIPAERMKMDLTHLVPLSKQALSVLYELKELTGHREYLFPSIPYPRKPMSDCTILNALKRMGYKNRMTGHGFRTLPLGVGKEILNYPHHVIDRQLSHAPKSNNDRAYDRATFLPQRKQFMQEYADYLDSLIGTKSKKDLAITLTEAHSYNLGFLSMSYKINQ